MKYKYSINLSKANFMKQKIIIISLLLIIAQACSNETPTTVTQEEHGQILFNLDKQNAPYDVTEIVVTLSRENYSDLVKSININEVDNAQVLFDNLDAGIWKIYVEAFNNKQVILYFGETEANVIPGIIVPINLQLNPTTGGININITWGTNLYNNVVAFYPFLGNANDYSGNSINGTIYGPTLTKDRFGNKNNAYFFDGLNDFIKVKKDEKLNIEGDLTISVWIKIESFNGVAESILRMTADNTDNPETNALYGLTFNYGSNKLTYVHESGQGLNHPHTFENFIFETSVWYNIVIVRDTNSKSVDLYINGSKEDSIEYNENPNNGNLSHLRIGENHNTVQSERFFHGIIDDILILNKTLSEKEIKFLYEFSN